MGIAPVFVIGAVIFICFFDNFSQFPVVAPYARALGATPALIGLVVAVYSITNLVGNLVSGYMLDHVDRRRLLIGGLGLAGVAVLFYGAAQTPTQLVVVRAIHGAAASVLAPAAFTLLGDYFPRGRRRGAMGANGAIIALAAMVAPAVSGLLRDRVGFTAVFLAVGSLLLLTALAASFLISSSKRTEEPTGTSRRRPLGVFLSLARRRSLSVAYLSGTVLTFGLGTLVAYLPLQMADLGFGGAQTGLALSAYALASFVAMASPLARVGSDRDRLVPAAAGLFIVGVALLLLPIRAELQLIWVFMALYGLGFGLIFPAANARVADATDRSERGSAFGLFYAFWSVGVILGSSMSGLLAEAGNPVSPFHVAAALALPSAVVVLLAAQPSGQVSAEPRTSVVKG